MTNKPFRIFVGYGAFIVVIILLYLFSYLALRISGVFVKLPASNFYAIELHCNAGREKSEELQMIAIDNLFFPLKYLESIINFEIKS